MRRSVKSRIDIHAEHYGWESARHGRLRYEKDGYEIYFFSNDDGFELTIRNPETMERETIVEVRDDDVPTDSPLYVAAIEHILMNAERIVANAR